MVRRLRVVVEDLYRFLPIVLSDGGVQRAALGHLPVDDALAALISSSGPASSASAASSSSTSASVTKVT